MTSICSSVSRTAVPFLRGLGRDVGRPELRADAALAQPRNVGVQALLRLVQVDLAGTTGRPSRGTARAGRCGRRRRGCRGGCCRASSVSTTGSREVVMGLAASFLSSATDAGTAHIKERARAKMRDVPARVRFMVINSRGGRCALRARWDAAYREGATLSMNFIEPTTGKIGEVKSGLRGNNPMKSPSGRVLHGEQPAGHGPEPAAHAPRTGGRGRHRPRIAAPLRRSRRKRPHSANWCGGTGR